MSIRATLFKFLKKLKAKRLGNFLAGFAFASGVFLISALPLHAAILWTDLGATLAHENGDGSDMLGGALEETDASTNTLYFKFHLDPISDVGVEPYFAAFELYDHDHERLAIGNSFQAWAYSAFNTLQTGDSNRVFGDMDLRSSRPEPAGDGTFRRYELPRHGIESTIVFKVQYVVGGDDLVTVWLNPYLGAGATEETEDTNLTTHFKANASFSEIRVRHGGGGGGWTFSDMAVATAFDDFVNENDSRGTPPLTFHSWQRDQGLPQSSIRALAQTRDGYLWLGSDNGVSRFDGVRFVSFGSREGLGGGPVRSLFGDSQGGLWIGSGGGGLTHFDHGQSTTFTTRNGLPADSISCLAEDDQGRMWIGTESGLAVYDHGVLKTSPGTPELREKPVTALVKDRRGNIWAGITGEGVYEITADHFTQIPDPTPEHLLRDPHSLLVDKSGRLWIGAGDDFVLCRDGSQWLRYQLPHHLARPYVSALAEEPDGTVWAGSVSEGLFEFKDGKLTPVNASSGLSDNLVESLLVDQEGKLWVGTDAGLNRIRPKDLTTIGQNEGLGYGAIQGLAQIGSNTLWAGKPNGGLYRWDGRDFSRIPAEAFGGIEPQVNALLSAKDSSCWVASVQGIFHFQDPGGSAPVANLPAELAGNDIVSLEEDREKGIWAGGREGGLWRFENNSWRVRTNFWQGHSVTAIVDDKDGWMWIGTAGDGLHQFNRTQHRRWGKKDGLESDLIRTLRLDPQGVLWIGTAGGGLSRLENGVIKTFTTHEGLPDNTISQILEDKLGRLWLGTDRGIVCVRKKDLADVAAGTVRSLYPLCYGRAEGMLSEECTGGFFPAGLQSASGLLCFPTLKGIVMADPRSTGNENHLPKLALEDILLDGERGPAFQNPAGSYLAAKAGQAGSKIEDASLRIPPGRHRIEFRYTGFSFNAPERIRFRYRLEGMDSGWVESGDAGTRRTASYGYVPPGDYLFTVTACDGEGDWDRRGASVAFTVLPHFWETWWFISLLIFGLLSAVGGAVRFFEKTKSQRRFKQLEQERALQRERARIAQDLHDDLGSSLTRISLLSGLARADRENPALVESHTAKISQSAEQTVRALEEIVWAVRPGSDSLQSLVEYISHFANELFESSSTRCRLDLPESLPDRPLPPEIRHDIFLVVKEALTNALKHSQAAEVRVQITFANDDLEILVQDNGRGFNPGNQGNQGPQNGLLNMRRRAESMGGTLAIHSVDEEGVNVRLRVRVPGHSPNGKT